MTVQVVIQKGNTDFVFESLETNCDQDYVEYFHKVPNSTMVYTFRVVKAISAFTIDIVVKVVKTQRVFYKTENIRGCDFLKNPLLFKMFGETYKKLVVNGSYFKCPITPKIYYLKNDATISIIPTLHPPGRFQLSMRVKIAQSSHPFAMEMLWKYRIMRIK
nr:uncharacterized protein LOC108063434 [Drosophila takahashii]